MESQKQFTSDGIEFLTEEQRAKVVEEIKAKFWGKIRAKGYNILVRPHVSEKKTKGGIIIADTAREEDQYHSQICQVIDVGPVAYTEKQVCGGMSWCSVGDWVLIPRTSGVRFNLDRRNSGDSSIGSDYEPEAMRIVREDDIIAIVNDPLDWKIRITATKY